MVEIFNFFLSSNIGFNLISSFAAGILLNKSFRQWCTLFLYRSITLKIEYWHVSKYDFKFT